METTGYIALFFVIIRQVKNDTEKNNGRTMAFSVGD